MPKFIRCDKCSGKGFIPKPNSKNTNELTFCNKCTFVRKRFPFLPEGWILENSK